MTDKDLSTLKLFGEYDQKTLAALWGYKSYDAIRRGIVTPANSNIIILFVTEDKAAYVTQYLDMLSGNILDMSGETGHGNDKRLIANLNGGKDTIYLFYRSVHHSPYIYYGEVTLIEYVENTDKPSHFKFAVHSLEECKAMNYYALKTSDYNIVKQFQTGTLDLMLDGINGYKGRGDVLSAGDPVFLVFGGDDVPWTLGLAAICKSLGGPCEEGYDTAKPKNYKVNCHVEASLPKVMQKVDFIPYKDSYDSFVGPNTKGSRNQALFKITEQQVVGILRGVLDKYPQLEKAIEDLFPKSVMAKVKSPMTVYLPMEKEYGDVTVPATPSKVSTVGVGENIILYGVPGAGKSHTIETEYCNDEDHMERVVFHPDYTYSDFVGQIMPKIKEGTDKLEYRFVAGPFTKIMKKAYTHPSESFYLIIEEINRGNAPAIFGDVFQLLDRNDDGISTYGITNQDIADIVYTGVGSDKKVKIPANLTIIATMNTADQSVFTLDTAFKRRWNMRMIPNDVENCKFANVKILGTDVTWETFVTVINDLILSENSDLTSTEDKRIGAYFVKRKDIELIDGKYNPAFAEKVLMYLWNDVFKFSRDTVFNEKYNSLDKLIKGFEAERFNVFNLEEFKIAAEGNESNES